jgi:CubicO group peptidase (beta-lactamase class C family)
MSSMQRNQQVGRRGIAASLWLIAAIGLPGGWACSGDDDDGSGGVDAGAEPDAEQPGEFDAFDEAVSAFVEDQGLEGASAVVVDRDGGQVHVQGYGAFDAGRLYLIASSSKILSVGVLMNLADQGLIDVDEPIGTYLEDPFGEGKPELTLAELVSNSSGLVSLADDPVYAPYLCQYLSAGTLSECAAAIYTADDAADRIPPDTEFHYGGGQWQLAGGVAEVTSGKTWAELIDETYVQPCGAESLGYTNQFERSALDYPTDFGGDVANLTQTDNPSIEGGAYITVEDYGKLLLMHLRGGLCGDARVLSEDAVERMRVDRILEVYGGTTGAGGSLEGYGLGWWIDRVNAGVFMDPGAYGAIPWLDVERGYGAFIALEATSAMGGSLVEQAKPALDAIFDARAERR